MKHANGYTLVDVLVVLVLVMLVAACAGPALSTDRDTARLAACTENLRQIGQGIDAYANDHQGHLPTPTHVRREGEAGAPSPLHGFEHIADAFHPWQVYIHPYIGEDYEITLDPAHRERMLEFSGTMPDLAPSGNEGHLWSNYGQNQRIFGSATARDRSRYAHRDRLAHPADTLSVADAGIYSLDFHQAWPNVEVRNQFYVPGAHEQFVGSRHDVPWAPADAVDGRHPDAAITAATLLGGGGR